MKIFSIDQIREADRYTIENEPISSILLMERAAEELFYWWLANNPYTETPVHIFCGLGNNGGDGLVLSRLLLKVGYPVTTYIVRYSEHSSSDFDANLTALEGCANNKIIELTPKSIIPVIQEEEQIVDAIFGSGLSKPVEGFPAKVIQHLNQSGAAKISIDMPSGLFADQPSDTKSAIVRADYTLSFQFPKLAFLFPENDAFVGHWEILDIGLHHDFINKTGTNHLYMTREDLSPSLKKRKRFSHKGTFGHALLIAGGYGKMGAAILTTKSAVRSGVGLVHTHVPRWGAAIMQTACPEAMLSIDRYEFYLSEMPKTGGYTAIGAGPGLGTEEQTQKAIKLLIQQTQVPLVLDADALNILSLNKTWIPFLQKNTILTPHPKEFERLVGTWRNDFERLEKQREMAVKHGLFVVLKGANTSVAFPDGKIYFNSTGNPGMATGGSGDVLTGLITGLLAQGYTPGIASVLGVYLHGLAGDIAARKISSQALSATDIIKHMGKAFKKLEK